MLMTINLVEDHNIYLCEGGPVYNGGVQPTPITYLTQWKIVGNSEVHGNEIWSCGEYNATDGKYHILVQPLGGSIADIALTEPLRKVNNVADTIEFPSGTDKKALVTRSIMYDTLDDKKWSASMSLGCIATSVFMKLAKKPTSSDTNANILVNGEITYSFTELTTHHYKGCALSTSSTLDYYVEGCMPESGKTPTQAFYDAIQGKYILFELATPTTELVDAPQIEEANSYTCVTIPGSNAVSWSSFETE